MYIYNLSTYYNDKITKISTCIYVGVIYKNCSLLDKIYNLDNRFRIVVCKSKSAEYFDINLFVNLPSTGVFTTKHIRNIVSKHEY